MMIHRRPFPPPLGFLQQTRTLSLAILLLTFLCLLTSAHGQNATATLSGSLSDQNGAVIPGVNITMTSMSTGAQRKATTNDEGYFTIPLLQPGSYKLNTQRDGFTPVEVQNIVLNVGDQKTLQIQLKAGDISASVQVTDEAPLINESPAVGTVVNRQFVENIPLNGRSFQSLITLTPGVVLTPTTFAKPGQFSVNGQRDNTNYFTVDGVSANIGITHANLGQSVSGSLPGLTADGGTNGLVSIDAMQEFRIQTSTYAPEFGRTPGAQISIISRSGTNQFRGTLFEYFRNDVLDANDWFANANRLRKPPLRQNDFGGVFGGPVLLPRFGEGTPHFYDSKRTFFFFSYEGLRLRRPQVAITSVPSLSARQNAAPAMRPFLDAYPLPTGTESLAAGYARLAASYSDQSALDATSIRIDHMVTERFTLFGRYNHAPSRSVARQAVLSSVLTVPGNIQTLTLGSTQSFTSKVSNDLRFNYSKAKGGQSFELDEFGGARPIAESSIFPSTVPSGNRRLFFQLISVINGVVNTQLTTGQSSDNEQRQYNLVDNLSYVFGTHQLKVGIDYRRLTPSSGQVYTQSPAFFFDPLIGTFPTRMTAGSGVIILDGLTYLTQNFSAYGQDTWRANPRLTLTYGLRWELNPPPKGKDKGISSAASLDNPATMALLPIGTPLWKTTYNNFAPRFGMAYQLSQKQGKETVIRGGVGIFYDLGIAGVAGLAESNFPYSRRRELGGLLFPLSAADAVPPPFTLIPVGQITMAYPPDLKLPRTYQWNVAVEQSLGTKQTASASYVAAVGRNLLRQGNLLNVNPSFSSVRFAKTTATSDYHAMQLQYQRRLSRGLQALASYTWSHSIDITSDDAINNLLHNLPFLGAIDARQDRGPSNFDVRHALSGAVTYNLPAPVASGIGRAVLGNWSVDSIFSARSATPVNVTYGVGVPGCCVVAVRPDLVPGIPLYIDDPTVPGGRRLNNAVTTVPGNPNPQIGPFLRPTQLRQGSLGRNALRGFPVWQVDLALRRQFNLTEQVNIQLKAEMFNVFNHPNFGNPSGTLSSSPLFGQPTSMLGRSLGSGGVGGGLNPLYQIGGPRSIQLAFRLAF